MNLPMFFVLCEVDMPIAFLYMYNGPAQLAVYVH